MRLMILGALLALATPAFADDAGPVAAALRDEASECRYLKSLCDDATNATTDQLQAARRFHDAATAFIANPLNRAAQDEESAAERANNAAPIVTAHFTHDLIQAATVIRAKHDKMPACFSECTLLNLDSFK
jgi:hypothetical protein